MNDFQLAPPHARARVRWEIAIVLLLSLGASALWAVLQLADRLTREEPLSQQTAAINQSRSSREFFDFAYQFLGFALEFAPVLLVVWLLWSARKPRLGALGIDGTRPVKDTVQGLALVLVIGIPGLLLYVVGRDLGITIPVLPAPLDTYWWTVPMLIFSALRAGVVEEVIAVGYLYARLTQLGFGRWGFILFSAVLRGSYHLYQGVGAFFGNLLMGALFGWLYSRNRRLLPLVIAHVLIDCAVFIGYPWAAGTFPEFFGLPG
ncbi:CPBP family intramembrane glutamic endopeptidase [Humidisolicoccus flavus]|uniref:CPBP family intramembrane glutamic endopeptidase n=1 Tax=Humidisolicoccus flavus TaxID=3111414 RepID=UPI00324B18BD